MLFSTDLFGVEWSVCTYITIWGRVTGNIYLFSVRNTYVDYKITSWDKENTVTSIIFQYILIWKFNGCVAETTSQDVCVNYCGCYRHQPYIELSRNAYKWRD